VNPCVAFCLLRFELLVQMFLNQVRMMIAQMEQQQMAQQNQLDAQQALQQRNPFAVFLQSLLPWMNFAEVGQVPPQLQDFDSSDYDSEHDDIDHDHEFN
jgi:hypothetical protein